MIAATNGGSLWYEVTSASTLNDISKCLKKMIVGITWLLQLILQKLLLSSDHLQKHVYCVEPIAVRNVDRGIYERQLIHSVG